MAKLSKELEVSGVGCAGYRHPTSDYVCIYSGRETRVLDGFKYIEFRGTMYSCKFQKWDVRDNVVPLLITFIFTLEERNAYTTVLNILNYVGKCKVGSFRSGICVITSSHF